MLDYTTSSKFPPTVMHVPSLRCSFHGALGQLHDRITRSKECALPFPSIASSSSSGCRRGGDRQVYLVTGNVRSIIFIFLVSSAKFVL